MNIFVNFTNHSSAYWDENQRKEALKYGMIRDMPFPAVDPESDEAYIDSLAYQVIKGLKERGILALIARSERVVKDMGKKKEVSFTFRRFRRY